jgi:hypothetical protein
MNRLQKPIVVGCWAVKPIEQVEVGESVGGCGPVVAIERDEGDIILSFAARSGLGDVIDQARLGGHGSRTYLIHSVGQPIAVLRKEAEMADQTEGADEPGEFKVPLPRVPLTDDDRRELQQRLNAGDNSMICIFDEDCVNSWVANAADNSVRRRPYTNGGGGDGLTPDEARREAQALLAAADAAEFGPGAWTKDGWQQTWRAKPQTDT